MKDAVSKKLGSQKKQAQATYVVLHMKDVHGIYSQIGRILWHEKSLRKRFSLPPFGHYFKTL